MVRPQAGSNLSLRGCREPRHGRRDRSASRTRMDWEAWARRTERALDMSGGGDWKGLFAPEATFGDPHTPSTKDLKGVARHTRKIFPGLAPGDHQHPRRRRLGGVRVDRPRNVHHARRPRRRNAGHDARRDDRRGEWRGARHLVARLSRQERAGRADSEGDESGESQETGGRRREREGSRNDDWREFRLP